MMSVIAIGARGAGGPLFSAMPRMPHLVAIAGYGAGGNLPPAMHRVSPVVAARADPRVAGNCLPGDPRASLPVMARPDRAIRRGTAPEKTGQPRLGRGCQNVVSQDDLIEQIVPSWVLTLDQVELPCPGPMLQPCFTPDGRDDIVERLVVDETYNFILGSISGANALAMFPGAAGDIVCNANIERSKWPIGHDVNPSAFHRAIVAAERLRKFEQGGGSVRSLRRFAAGSLTRPAVPVRMARSSRAMTSKKRHLAATCERPSP